MNETPKAEKRTSIKYYVPLGDDELTLRLTETGTFDFDTALLDPYIELTFDDLIAVRDGIAWIINDLVGETE